MSQKRLGLEYLSALGLPPVEFIRVAGDLGCGHVSLNLSGSANRLAVYPEARWRSDPAARREIGAALRDSGVALSHLEGFAVTPRTSAADLLRDLDVAAELQARAICTVSLDTDMDRTHDQFARLAEHAAAHGMITTTEVGAGVLRTLPRALEALAAVGNPAFRLLVDTMHLFRSGATLADFAALDPRSLGHVQLCDVPMPAVIESYMEEALYERRAPGDGDLPLAEFVRLLPDDVPVGLEIPIRSEAQAGIGTHERFARCLEAARSLYSGAG